MNKALLLPLIIFKFWYFDAPVEMIKIFASFNSYFMQLFALPLCLSTFFKPLKNEYREGLVGFSRAIGILVKTVFISTDLFMLILLLFTEFFVVISFLFFPVATVMLLVY